MLYSWQNKRSLDVGGSVVHRLGKSFTLSLHQTTTTSAFTQQRPELYTIMMTRVQEMPVMNRNMLMLTRAEFASFCRQHCEPG